MKYVLSIMAIFILFMNQSCSALICPDPKHIILKNGHWHILGDPTWKEAPFVSSSGKNPVFGGAMWNNGWQPDNLKDRPHCFYWLDGLEGHTEFIYFYKTVNPKNCYPSQWKMAGGYSKGVICTTGSRLKCIYPINHC